MKLGEAYVNIRADLKPYQRDLQAGLRATTAAFEKSMNKELGRRLGKEISEGTRESLVKGAEVTAKEVRDRIGRSGQESRRGFRRNVSTGIQDGIFDVISKGGRELWQFITSSLASALDDGISALPVELKAAIATGLLAASPAIIAFIGSAVSAGVSLGFAGLGILLASQLQPVQDAFGEFIERARTALVRSAGPLIDPILNSLERVGAYIEQTLAPILSSIFEAIAPGLEALITGLTVGIGAFFDQLSLTSEDMAYFLAQIGDGLAEIGASLGTALRIIIQSGSSGQRALQDLLTIVSLAVLGFGVLVRVATELYRTLRDIGLIVSGNWLQVGIEHANDAIRDQQISVFNLGKEYGGLEVATDRATKAVEEQTKAWEANQKALKEISDAASDLVSKKIDVQESWDELTEAIKENGKTLDITGEKGRENARKTQKYLEDTKAVLKDRVAAGEITAEQAEILLAREVTALEKVFGKTKEGKKVFDELFGSMIRAFSAELDPSPWVTAFNKIATAVGRATDRIKELIRNAKNIGLTSGDIKVGGGTQISGFATGGRVTSPTLAMLSENSRPELVIPETNPGRAMQILANSALSGLLGGQAQVVNVYVGNEQLDSRTVKIARGVNRQAARTTNHVPRSI